MITSGSRRLVTTDLLRSVHCYRIMTTAMLLTILGFGLFIFAIRTINRWDGGRIPI
jgi:hypothetical protein